MASKLFYVDIDLAEQQLVNASFERLAADPLTGFEGQLIYNTTDERVKYWDATNTQWRAVVHLDDLEAFSTYVGAHDASANALPATGSGPAGAIRAGDRFVITVASTGTGIVGLGGGSPILEVGDVLTAITDGAAVAADFIATQTNLDVTGLAKTENVALAALPANTPTAIPLVDVTTINMCQVFNAAGEEIVVRIDKANAEIESNVALTNLTISVVGF